MGCIDAVFDGASYGIVSGFIIGAAVGAVYAKIFKIQHVRPWAVQNGINNAIFGVLNFIMTSKPDEHKKPMSKVFPGFLFNITKHGPTQKKEKQDSTTHSKKEAPSTSKAPSDAPKSPKASEEKSKTPETTLRSFTKSKISSKPKAEKVSKSFDSKKKGKDFHKKVEEVVEVSSKPERSFSSVKDYPGKDNAVKEHSVKDFPMKEHSLKDFPMKEHSLKDFPMKEQSLKDFPMKEHSLKDFPMREHSLKDFPMREHSIKDYPMKEHSLKDYPMKEHSIKDYPIKEHSVKDYPMKEHSVKDYPMKEHSVKDYPMKEHSVKDYPMKEHSIKEYLTKDHSVKDYPVKDHLGKDHSVKEYPVKDHSGKNIGVSGLSKSHDKLAMCIINEKSNVGSSASHSSNVSKKSKKSEHSSGYKEILKLRHEAKESSDKESNYNENQMMNFFFEAQNTFARKSKFTQMNVVEEETPEILRRRIYDFTVSPEEDLQYKTYMKELVIYVLFLTFLTFVTLSMISQTMFFLTNLTEKLFFDTPNVINTTLWNLTDDSHWILLDHKSLRNSKTIGGFWAFVESTLLDMLYWDFYNPILDPRSHVGADDRKMFYENQILGVARMRQVRVRDDSCKIHPDVKRHFIKCFAQYSVFAEETRPIKNGLAVTYSSTAWKYTEAADLGSSYYWGQVSVYGGGGYYVDFPLYKDEAKDMIKELKDNYWISRGTRAVFIDFNLYNANVNLFCLCKIVIEFPPVGGIIPTADFHSLKLINYLNHFDFAVLACELIVTVFVAYYTYQFIKVFRQKKMAYFFHLWNYVDITVLILSYLHIIFGVVVQEFSRSLVASLASRYYKYTEFSLVRHLKVHYNNVIAVHLFVSWVKLFKFLSFNTTMMEFRKTLSRSLRDILGFFPMFITMFVAFALLAFLLFGNHVYHYKTVGDSFLSLFKAFLGEFEYEEIENSNRVLGPIFYIAFIFFIFFVLLNVFIAIINDAYSAVKSEIISDTPKTSQYFKRGFLNFLGACCCGLDRKVSNRSKTKRKIIYEEIKRALQNAGFNDTEIKVFFAKYDINVNNILNIRTRRKILEDLELKQIDFSKTAEQNQIYNLQRQFNGLEQRLDEIELNLQPVVDKVDIVLSRS